MNRKQIIKSKLHNFTEEIIIGLVMLFVLLPVRVIFVQYVSTNWFGSFGMISAIVITLLILSKKNKLGIFGRMFWKQTIKVTKGKRKIISYTFLSLNIFIWSAGVIGITYADSNDEIKQAHQRLLDSISPEEKQEIAEFEKAIEDKDVQKVRQTLDNSLKQIPPEFFIAGFFLIFIMPFVDFNSWALITYMMNDFSKGYLLHFGTVFIVEALEVLGIIIYAQIITRNQPKTDNH